jgi:hypothetical protein
MAVSIGVGLSEGESRLVANSVDGSKFFKTPLYALLARIYNMTFIEGEFAV